MKGPEWFHEAFGAHYPVLYQHRDRAEALRAIELLPRLAPLALRPEDLILDLGCGDGRHLEEIRDAGHAAVGLDLSWPLLRKAQERLRGTHTGCLVRGDMRCLPVAPGSVTSVLSLFTAFGYLGPLEANDVIVREVSRVLRSGGHWFLDYFDGNAVRRELGGGDRASRQREIGPLLVRDTRQLGPRGSTVVKEVYLSPLVGQQKQALELGIGPDGLSYREEVAVFSLDEMDALAGAHRLVRVAAAGSYDGVPVGDGDRWILVYRKKHDGSRKDS